MDLCCTKGVFAEPGWSSYRQKRIPRLETDRSLGDERLVCHLDWKFTPLGFYRAISVTKTPRLQLFLDARRQTRRQRSQTTGLARVHRLHRLSYSLMVHILPICIPSHQLYEKLSSRPMVSWPYQIKQELSQFLLKKKLVWFCEWAIMTMRVGRLAWVRQLSTLKESSRQRPRSAMSRKTPGEVRARTCGTNSPSRSEALRFIDSSKSPSTKIDGSLVNFRRRLSNRHGRPRKMLIWTFEGNTDQTVSTSTWFAQVGSSVLIELGQIAGSAKCMRVGRLAWVRQLSTLKESSRQRPRRAMSRKTPGEVRARTCGTKSPSRSEALRFIDSFKSPSSKISNKLAGGVARLGGSMVEHQPRLLGSRVRFPAGAFAIFSVSAKASLPISLPPSLPLSFSSSSFPFLFLPLRPFVCALKSHSSHLSLQ